MHKYKLDRDWKLRSEELFWSKDYYSRLINKNEGWLDVIELPCDVHIPLIENGLIDDPVTAENCYKSEWIEDKSWWFKKSFCVDEECLGSQNIELVMEGLDVKADIFLNGCYIGHQKSQTYPFRKDVKDILIKGENILVVRVTSGLEYFSELQMSGHHWKGEGYTSNRFIRECGDRRDDRRIFLRKPQYVYGWDWNPRIATCGITGEARIEAYDDIAIRGAKFTTKEILEDSAKVDLQIEIENLYPVSTLNAEVSVEVWFDNEKVFTEKKDMFARSGLNHISMDFFIENPKLWWPNGMGEQNLYTVKIKAVTENNSEESYEFNTGIRIIKLDTEKLGVGRRFAVQINGVRTFCKGGNWVVADSIYSRVTDDKYEELIKEAKEANFNMLRFNGVGAYERDYFYECCDRCGILIWQDFLFSCAAYPDQLEWFRHEAEKEVEYQIKRLRNHPCIALWSGNNECQITIEGWGKYSYLHEEKKAPFPLGIDIYNKIMPRLVKEFCPDIPYWNSSPYGGVNIESTEYGDTHSWGCFMNEDIENRIALQEYDKVKSRFVSEFGCVGPTKKPSLVKYYGSKDITVGSNNWNLHTNEFEKGTISAAISKHYVDAEGLSIDDYLLYSGLFQGAMLGYAYESFRCLKENSGALLWSYNDCRGEVGWSIIDYYLVRKISYYFVKRALAHKKLAMRRSDGGIKVIFMNDTPDDIEFEIEFGYISFDGSIKDTEKSIIKSKPFEKAQVAAKIKAAEHDTAKGVFFVKAVEDSEILPAILSDIDFREMKIITPSLKIDGFRKEDKEVEFVVSTDNFVHSVYFNLGDDVLLSDEYFDLLPGETRRITLSGDIKSLNEADINPRYVFVQ